MNLGDEAILVVGDELENGELVQELLSNHFSNVQMCCDPAQHAACLAEVQPVVLVLAFSALEDSRGFMKTSLEADATLAQRAHGKVVLCDSREVLKAFELCRDSVFDDYVMFWPITHDGARLPMAVLQALRNAAPRDGGALPHQETPPASATGPAPAKDGNLVRESESVAAAMKQLLASRGLDGDTQEHALLTAEAEISPLPPLRRHEPRTVLFVDDDPHQHTTMRLLLDDTHYNPVFTDTAQNAMRILQTLSPGIILVDINLPDGSGVDLIRTIKAIPALARTPIITVSGNRTREVLFDAISAGAADFIAKPYSKATLLAKMMRVMHARPDSGATLIAAAAAAHRRGT